MSNLIDKAEEAQKRKLDFAREQSDRAAVASGNVDENSALYRHAKLNGWDLGEDKELHGPARANAVARDAAATDIVEQRAAGAPRSPISGFGADMDTGRFTRYGNDGTAADSPAQQMYQQLGQLVERGKAERQRKRNLDDAALSYCMVNAKEGNGFVSPDVLKAVSSQLGQEITGGNYTADGNFVLYGPKEVRDPGSGRVVRNGMSPIAVASPEMQMRVLQRSGLGQGLQEQLWDYMTAPGRLTPQQVRDRGFTDPRAAQRDAEAKAAAAQSKIDEQKRQFDEKMKLERERLAARQGGGGRYDSRRAQGMKDWLDQNGKTVQDPSAPDDPTARIDNPNFDEKLYNDRLAQYNDYIWQSNLPPAQAINGDERQGQFLDENRRPIAPAASQQSAQGKDSNWTWDSYEWNPDNKKTGRRIDPKDIKGTGIAFDAEKNRLKVPKGREKEFEDYMDRLAKLYNPLVWDRENDRPMLKKDGKTYLGKDPSRPASNLVPPDWREKQGKGGFDADYDYVAAFLAGAEPGVNPEDGAWHLGDAGKMPTHPTFSEESYYAKDPKYAPLAGRWEGEAYMPGEAERAVQKSASVPPAAADLGGNAQDTGPSQGVVVKRARAKDGTMWELVRMPDGTTQERPAQ